MNMYPSQVSPPRTPGSNEYVPLAGVPSKNTGQWWWCVVGVGGDVVTWGWRWREVDGGAMMLMASFEDGGDGCDVGWRWAAGDSPERRWAAPEKQGRRGSQRYDGASNMRGEWNDLQALILKECPYVYYVHCFAHQLQLALVSAYKEVAEVHKNIIVNVISSSCKRNDKLIDAQVGEIVHLAKIREPSRLEKDKIKSKVSTTSQKGDVACCLEQLRSFDFVIGMHIMNEIMEITDKICQALQHKSHDIINALALVSTTKTLLQRLRDEDWQSLMVHKRRTCAVRNIITELLRLSVALDQRKSFNIDDICKLVMKYYPLDFTD
ncbi:zinc finger MYM-type protein 1-like protein [Tanacetum coccineum]